MARAESYKEHLLDSLRDTNAAAAYLTACLDDENPQVFLLAVRDVADVYGGLREVSRRTGLNRESLYRMLSRSGNPELRSLRSVLASLDLRLTVGAKPQQHHGKKGMQQSPRSPRRATK